MKIVQISAYYPPHLGGQENVVQDLATTLASRGHTVYVLTSTLGGGRPGLTEERGVKVIRLAAWQFGHAAIMPAFLAKLMQIADKNTIVHLHIGQAFTPEMTLLASRVQRFAYVAQLHIDFQPSGPASFLLPAYKRLILGPVLRQASAVVVLNAQAEALVRDTYHRQKGIRIMSNGLDEAYFTIRRQEHHKVPSPLRLLTVGRLTEQKNIESLLQAIALTKRALHLDVVGDGDQRNQLTLLAQSLGIGKQVTFHGRHSRKDVLTFYENSDALVMPSLYEAQPLVLLEAMAARIPILGTNVTGVAEHIKDIGICVEPTPQGLAEGLERLSAEYGRMSTAVRRGSKKTQALRWPVLVKEFETLYKKVSA